VSYAEVASREAADVRRPGDKTCPRDPGRDERRRHAYLQRIEQDRERAVSQITYLYDQRQDAIAELARLQTTVQAVRRGDGSQPARTSCPGVAVAGVSRGDRRQSDASAEDGSNERPDRALGGPGVPVSAVSSHQHLAPSTVARSRWGAMRSALPAGSRPGTKEVTRR